MNFISIINNAIGLSNGKSANINSYFFHQIYIYVTKSTNNENVYNMNMSNQWLIPGCLYTILLYAGRTCKIEAYLQITRSFTTSFRAKYYLPLKIPGKIPELSLSQATHSKSVHDRNKSQSHANVVVWFKEYIYHWNHTWFIS